MELKFRKKVNEPRNVRKRKRWGKRLLERKYTTWYIKKKINIKEVYLSVAKASFARALHFADDLKKRFSHVKNITHF